jgi:hypothetical protein
VPVSRDRGNSPSFVRELWRAWSFSRILLIKTAPPRASAVAQRAGASRPPNPANLLAARRFRPSLPVRASNFDNNPARVIVWRNQKLRRVSRYISPWI